MIRNSTASHLIVSEILPPKIGGSGRWLWEVYGRLVQRGEKIVFLGPNDETDEAFDAAHEFDVVRTRFRPMATGGFTPSGMREYLRLLGDVRRIHREHRIGLVHCGCCITPGWVGYLFKQLYGVPYICYVHGEDVNLSEPITGLLSSRQHRWMTRIVLRAAARIVTNSNNTLRILERDWNVHPKKVSIIHPGVDTNAYAIESACEQARSRLGWADRSVVLTVSRLQKRKGQDMLIRALPAIREKCPSVLYAIVGDGEEKERLQGLAEELGVQNAVEFYSNVSDGELLEFYQQCDLFALPNRQIGSDIEGFGIVLLEAQACGKPVIAGDSGGTAETMSIPETGLVVRCDEPDELAVKVAELLGDRERLNKMGVAARQWVEERFAWEQIASQTVEDLWGYARTA